MADKIDYNVVDINTKNIKVHPWCQRSLETPKRQRQFRQIMRDFDPYQVKPIQVCLINGQYICVDGQLTMKVLKERNGGRDLAVKCRVLEHITDYRGAAEYFLNQAKQNPIDLNDKWDVDLHWGFDQATANITKAVEANGMNVSTDYKKGDNMICATKTLQSVYKSLGSYEEFEHYIWILKSAWGGEESSLQKKILDGLALFCKKYKGQYKDNVLISHLRKIDPVELIRQAEVDRSGGNKKYAAKILYQYNYRLSEQSRLPYIL